MRRVWFGRAIVAAATFLWLVACGRVIGVGVTQPSRWHEITVTTADGTTVPGDTFDCRLNAFQRDGLIYRTCDREGIGVYVVAVDPARRTAVASAQLPPMFLPPRWFAAVAAAPAGGLTILGADDYPVARLASGGAVEALPTPPDTGLTYGFGWRAGRLELVAAPFDEGASGVAPAAVSNLTAPIPRVRAAGDGRDR